MESDTRIELFVRSLAQTGATRRIEDTLDRLDDLEDRGDVADYTVTVWGREIGTAARRTATGRHILDSIESFEDWAATAGASVDRFYETRTVERDLTGETYSVTDLPVVAMAEYENGVLGHVTPHEKEGVVRTVQDRLDDIARRDGSEREEQAAAPSV